MTIEAISKPSIGFNVKVDNRRDILHISETGRLASNRNSGPRGVFEMASTVSEEA